eukprot:gene6720-355_t
MCGGVARSSRSKWCLCLCERLCVWVSSSCLDTLCARHKTAVSNTIETFPHVGKNQKQPGSRDPDRKEGYLQHQQESPAVLLVVDDYTQVVAAAAAAAAAGAAVAVP